MLQLLDYSHRAYSTQALRTLSLALVFTAGMSFRKVVVINFDGSAEKPRVTRRKTI
jgi:hypothetical protein